MTRAVAVLRPEPGNAVTAERVEARGLAAIRLPLFGVRALDWPPPDPADFDALFLTSANAVRLAGPGLAMLRDLPVHAVGEATAAAAQGAGFDVVAIGDSNAAALVDAAAARGVKRALLVSGRERVLDEGIIVARAIAVYAADALPAPDVTPLAGCVALLHSPRTAQRLGALLDGAGIPRAGVRIAALSAAVAAAAGTGWDRVVAAPTPNDIALLDVASPLAD